MLASALIARFVRLSPSGAPSEAFMRLYLEVYGDGTPLLDTFVPTPVTPFRASKAHAAQLAATLIEWAQRLDRADVQVHQEGALARFEGAAQAPMFGRNVGAQNARTKTTQFYAAVIRAAVATAHSRTYTIPATLWQGASVALTEAVASAATFHAASDALNQQPPADRPELAHLSRDPKELQRDLGRAAAMHQTAMAETIGCLWTAEGGPWLRVVNSVEQLREMGQGLIVGVEIPQGDLSRVLVANLDPQHGGGTFGLGTQPVDAFAACDAAIQIVAALGRPLPTTTRYVTTRMDPDSLVAAMILSGRIPLGTALANQRLIDELAVLDDGRPSGVPWVKKAPEPQTVGDHLEWGAVGALCLAYTRSGAPASALMGLEAAVWAALGASAMLNYTEARSRQGSAWSAIPDILKRIRACGNVAVGKDLPFGAATWPAIYSVAPIGLLDSASPSGGAGRKYTVACHRGLGDRGPEFHAAFRRLVGFLEKGWAGAATITGSPLPGGSMLTQDQVLQLVQQAAREAGITEGLTGTSTVGAPGFLR